MISKKSHFAYMLLCADSTIYSGYTVDLEKRLHSHNSGTASKYTRSRRPVQLAYYEEFSSKSEAMKREAAFKKLPKCEKLLLINSKKQHLAP